MRFNGNCCIFPLVLAIFLINVAKVASFVKSNFLNIQKTQGVVELTSSCQICRVTPGQASQEQRILFDRPIPLRSFSLTLNAKNKLTDEIISKDITEDDRKSGSEIDESNDKDFPAWVRNIYQSTKPSSTPTTEEEKAKKDAFSQSASAKNSKNTLENFINFEKMLSARGEETVAEYSTLAEISAWDSWVNVLQRRIQGLYDDVSPSSTSTDPTKKSTVPPASLSSPDTLLQDLSKKVEDMLSQAQGVGNTPFQTIVQQGRQFLSEDNIVEEAQRAARSTGLDDTQAAERANETLSFVDSLVTVADKVLRNGYVTMDEADQGIISNAREISTVSDKYVASEDSEGEALFANIPSAREIPINEYGPAIHKAAEMARLSAAIYEETIPRCFEIGHSIVAEGCAAHVRWMVTDSVGKDTDFFRFPKGYITQPKSIHVRTITIRGYDASDEEVDRAQLLTDICALKSQPLENNNSVQVHSGIMSLATAIYDDIKKYIDWTGPQQRLVFNGHSIGGSVSILLMLLMAKDKGVPFVKRKLLRVFTFGSPPILRFADESKNKLDIKAGTKNGDIYSCGILSALGLPSSLVYSYIQPWDPIVRLFSELDGLYPLIDDLGEDGKTLYINGPPRALRFVARGLVEAWGEGWPEFRDIVVDGGPQNYRGVGIQHILMPEPIRYLTDRFVSINVDVPQLDQVVRVSSRDLYPSLEDRFPLSVFELSTVQAALRGFIHHFYPAYDVPMVEYSDNEKFQQERENDNVYNKVNSEELAKSDPANTDELGTSAVAEEGNKGDSNWGLASQWLS